MRYEGIIGYGISEETAPDVFEQKIVEHHYAGDVIRNNSKWVRGDGLNDDRDVGNRISIVADPFAYQHASNIRYATWLGTKWKVTNFEVEPPRILLDIGGVYNENEI